MAALRQLAQTGNTREVGEQARRLLALDERYAPFARRVLTLAVGYNSKAIVALVEKAPERGGPG
jgi:hypothetical protein